MFYGMLFGRELMIIFLKIINSTIHMLQLRNLLILLVLFFYSTAYTQVTVDFSANKNTGCEYLQVAFTDLSSSTAGNIVAWSWDFDGNTSTAQNPGNVFSTPSQYTICLTATDDKGNSNQVCKTNFIQVFSIPEVDFEADPIGGCAPLHVEFTDLTTPGDGNIVEWIWGVGGASGVIINDGSMTSIENDYPSADDYTISLTVRDDNGCVNTLTRPNFIKVNEPPVIAFSAPVLSSCTAPFTVNFQNESIDPTLDYFWTFGNGQTYNGANPPPVVYTDEGTYNIELSVEDPITGCSAVLIKDSYIFVAVPIEISANKMEACVNEPIIFRDLSGTVADSLVWDFGDGKTFNKLSPTHKYKAPGCYTVSVTRYIGTCISTSTLTTCITINPIPDVDYTINNLIGCSLPHQVTATGISSTAVVWNWDFGNGLTSSGQNPVVDLPDFGIYPVTLEVIDANGCSNTISTDTIKVIEMVAEKDFGTLLGCVPLEVTLGENSTTVSPIVAWNWEVRDAFGATPPIVYNSTLENPTFTIVDTGIYNVRLEVTNDLGCMTSQIFPVSILAGQPPEVDFNPSETEVCFKDDATFVNNSSSYANGYLWDFGDGTYSEEKEPRHNWSDTGYFDVTLTVFHYGCPNSLTIPDAVRFLPPISNFKTELTCLKSLQREFTDLSVGADAIYWDFGVDGVTIDTSTEASPTFDFPAPGSYFVTQITTNFIAGCQDTLVKEINVTDPVADFSIPELEGCAPFTIKVSNLSTGASTYLWSSQDGEFSNVKAKEPTITFNDPGDYTNIKLVVKDIHKCRDTMILTDTIKVTEIIPNITPLDAYSCGAGTVNFQDQSTSSRTSITAWEWDLGNGETSTDQNPMGTYTANGIYDVSLKVTDADGCSDTAVFEQIVTISIPEARFIVDRVGCTQSALRFKNRSKGQNLTYSYDFGDGTFSSAKNPLHTYAAEGIYQVCLTVTDPKGCSDDFCLIKLIEITDPVANFTADNLFGACPPLVVNFENLSTNATNYEWDFGDQSGTSNLESPPHVYTLPGVYDVMLKVWSTPACVDSILLSDYISLEGPIGEFDFVVEQTCKPGIVTFAAQSIEPYNYYWDFGNGSIDTTFNTTADTFSYTYETAGNYLPKLILANDGGCKRVIEASQSFEIANLDFDFFASDSLFCDSSNPNPTFSFEDNSFTPYTGFTWEFEGGDIQTSTDLNPSVTYSTPGSYDVLLILENDFCLDSLLKEDYIKVGATPVADFTESQSSGCVPSDISFTDNSTVDAATIVAWNWTVEGVDSSDQQNPQFHFDEAGDFVVNLVVTSEIGCTATRTKNISIHPLPEVEISGENDICIGAGSQLSVNFISAPTGVTYNWSPDPSLSCTGCLNPIATPSTTTTYVLNVTDTNGCTSAFDYTIDVLPYTVPEFEISPDTTICFGSIVQLNALASGGGTEFNYDWGPNTADLNCDNCFNPVAGPAASTQYIITVSNEHGCQKIDSVNVDVINDSQDFLGADETICIEGLVQLNISYGSNPVWLEYGELDCTNCFDPVASPTTTTTYVAQVESINGCLIKDTLTINVQTPQVVDAGEDQVLCAGQVLFLEGEGQGTPRWNAEPSLSNVNILNPQASPSQTTTYVLNVFDGVCESSDSVKIEIIDKASISGEDQTICAGDTVQLSVTGLANEFSWYPENGLSSVYLPNPLAMPTETTEYMVIGSVFGCEEDTLFLTVNVDPIPSLSLIPVKSFFPENSVEIDLGLEKDWENYNILWSPALNLSCSDCPNPIARVEASTVFNVEVQDLESGCMTTGQTLVSLRTDCGDDLVFAPNAFSPNNDGDNDIFKVYSSTVTQITGMEIYDRWGGVLYQTTNMAEGWDGRSNGDYLPNGVYVYFIEAICPLDGSTMVIKGDISIMR